MEKHRSKPGDLSRREFIAMAGAMGASVVFATTDCLASAEWRERRDLYPEGVASGDPASESVFLWTRRPFDDGRNRARLTVEIAEDEAFRRKIAQPSQQPPLVGCLAVAFASRTNRIEAGF